MGIDKPDVRFVVHYDVPKSLEGYYQETGRSGRDGLEGVCLMFYSHNDLNKLEKFNKDKSVQGAWECARILLQEMEFYAESPVCRRRQLLHYFGEEFKGRQCGMCDNCVHPRERFDGTEYVRRIFLESKTNHRGGLAEPYCECCARCRGWIRKSYGHFDLPIYGKGDTESDDFGNRLGRQALIYQYLEKDIGECWRAQVVWKGKKFWRSRIQLSWQKKKTTTSPPTWTMGGIVRQNLRHQLNLTMPSCSRCLNAASKEKVRKRKASTFYNLPRPIIGRDGYYLSTTKMNSPRWTVWAWAKKQVRERVFGSNQQIRWRKQIPPTMWWWKFQLNKSKTKIFIIQQIDKKGWPRRN